LTEAYALRTREHRSELYDKSFQKYHLQVMPNRVQDMEEQDIATRQEVKNYQLTGEESW
jgi:hypothetical protein